MGNSSTKVEKQDDTIIVQQQHTSIIRRLKNNKLPNEYHGTSAIEVLNEVLRYIKLEATDVKQQNEQLKTMITEKIVGEGLRSDPLFERLFQNIFWTGSYYEGLKISAPDEFDLIMILVLPRTKDMQVMVTTTKAPPGYVQVKNLGQVLKHLESTNHQHWDVYKKMTTWCDGNGSLLQSKVRTWIEGLIDAYLKRHGPQLLSKFQLKSISMSKQGPAFTIQVEKIKGTNMDVDLVPALEFKEPIVPPQPFKPLTKPNQVSKPWYAIPKSATGNEPVKWDNCWKVCCSRQERDMIHSKNTLKPAIKLIKRLRDEKNWKSLKSYFIKTVAFWSIRDKKIYLDQTLDKVFLQLLNLLLERLQVKKIFNFWDPRHNMLENMEKSTCDNMAGELKRIITKIELNWNTNPTEIGYIIAPDREIN